MQAGIGACVRVCVCAGGRQKKAKSVGRDLKGAKQRGLSGREGELSCRGSHLQ